MKEYKVTSPSLDGLLAHESILYGGINRPTKILRIYDSPANTSLEYSGNENDKMELERYFADLYGVFMKKFSHFVVDRDIYEDDTLTLLAMLQEMVKVKKILIS